MLLSKREKMSETMETDATRMLNPLQSKGALSDINRAEIEAKKHVM